MKAFVGSWNVQCGRRAIAIAIGSCVLLALPGCGIPLLRPPTPGPKLPENFFLPQNFNGPTGRENSSQIGVREFFNDPTLMNLVAQSLANNQELKILAEDIQIANNEILRRRGTYFPFLSFGAGASLNKYSYNTLIGADNLQNIPLNSPNFPTPLPDFLAPSANLTWQIDIWRQLRNSRDAAILRWFGTTDGRNYVVTRVVAEIADSYYMLMALDQRLANLNSIIALQEHSLAIAAARKAAARGTELAVQRFQAEVRKNQSQRLIIRQQMIEVENRINFLAGRYPQPVQRNSAGFIELNLRTLNVGVPPQLLLNRPDIRQAERELTAAGIDVRVARANFFPKLFITGGVGYEAFNPNYMFLTPESLIYNIAGSLVAPLVNRAAIKADYLNANARQLQALYDYQRITLNAFTEVVNRISKVQNYTISIEFKKQQVTALERSVDVASNLFLNARAEYIDVLFAQRDLFDARRDLIDTKQEQLSAIVNAYQALGGGWRMGPPEPAAQPVVRAAPPRKPEAVSKPPAKDENLPAPN